MVTPAPRRTVRRESFISHLSDISRGGPTLRAAPRPERSFLQELRARHDGLDQRAESIAVRRELRVHPLDERFIREQQRPAKGVYQHFTTKVVQKVLFPVRADVALQAGEARPLGASGKYRLRVDGVSGQVFRPRFADGPVAFERQPERIESRMARRARRIVAMLRQHVPQRQVQLGFILRQLRDSRRWRGNHLAEHAAGDPVASLHRAGPQPRRVMRQERRHGKETAALVVARVVYATPCLGRTDHSRASHSVWPVRNWRTCGCRTACRAPSGRCGRHR